VLYGCDAIGGNNYGRWCDAEFDKRIKQAKAINDKDQRSVLYKEAQQILKREVPITPIAHSTVYQPMSKKVQDFKISPFGLVSFYGVSVGE
jgi:dipeptide transport system substrate-binding protein